MKKYLFIPFAVLAMCLGFTACSNDDDSSGSRFRHDSSLTAEILWVTPNLAKVMCTDRLVGVAYSDDEEALKGYASGNGDNLSVAHCRSDIEYNAGLVLCDLKPNTVYYCQTWLGESYGDVFTIKTHVEIGECVDLGLSVLWGGKNLGAESFSEVGDSYWWGCVHPVKYYHYTDMPPLSDVFLNDVNSISGNIYWDAATYNLGEPWRIPTREEIKELNEKCRHTILYEGDWTLGIYYEAENGQHLFIPSCGVSEFDISTYGSCILGNIGFCKDPNPVYIWSGSGSTQTKLASCMKNDKITSEYAYWAMPIRPVREK